MQNGQNRSLLPRSENKVTIVTHMSQKTVLVTGGSGFIGSHVALECSLKNYRVVLVDEKQPQVFEYSAWDNVQFVQCNILDKQGLMEVFRRERPDVVVHMAAKIEVEESQREPAKYYDHNVNGTRVLLECMRENQVSNIVFSSTAAVYGNVQLSTAIPEEYADAVIPVSVYGKTKRFCEFMISDYVNAYGFKAIVFRYFNAAGASPARNLGENREHETHLIPVVLDRLLKGKPVFIFGNQYDTRDGTCVRDYVHVADLARAHRMGIDILLQQEGSFFKTMNLGSSAGMTVKEVLDECIRVSSVADPVINISGPRAGDVGVLVADSSEAKRFLGWEAVKTVKDIVEDTWMWLEILERWRKQYGVSVHQ
eukprot:ANDGO_02680.mRNA.1 UDP-glucose 4-epimerase